MISKCIIGSLALLGLTQAGKCPFGYGGDTQKRAAVQLSEHDAENVQLDDIVLAAVGNNTTAGNATTVDFSKYKYPSDILTCPAGKIQVQSAGSFDKDMYEVLFRRIATYVDQLNPEDVGSFAGCLVRLAGHDFMDFRLTNEGKTSIGGSDGCVNFEDPDNKGLAQCLIRFKVADIYADFCDKLSLADFVVASAENVMARLETHYNSQDPFKDPESLANRFRSGFMVGRQTVQKCPNAVGLMPNPENGCNDLKNIFVENIFKKKFHRWKAWRAVAAISGAHTLGSAKVENSGYNGHWSTPEDQGKFNNGYFKSMLSRGWGPERNVSGNENKNQWKRIDNLPRNNGDFHEMMLNTDMCLAYQYNALHADCMKKSNRRTGPCNKFQRKGVFLNAKNNSCCAWTNAHILIHDRFGPVQSRKKNDICGEHYINGDFRGVCCQLEPDDSVGDCDAMNWPKGVAFDHILKFAGNEQEFYKAFVEAWKAATENGFPKPLKIIS